MQTEKTDTLRIVEAIASSLKATALLRYEWQLERWEHQRPGQVIGHAERERLLDESFRRVAAQLEPDSPLHLHVMPICEEIKAQLRRVVEVGEPG